MLKFAFGWLGSRLCRVSNQVSSLSALAISCFCLCRRHAHICDQFLFLCFFLFLFLFVSFWFYFFPFGPFNWFYLKIVVPSRSISSQVLTCLTSAPSGALIEIEMQKHQARQFHIMIASGAILSVSSVKRFPTLYVHILAPTCIMIFPSFLFQWCQLFESERGFRK